MKKVEVGKYVVSDPSICHGQLTFRGTRVMVGPVLASLANGKTIDDIVTKSWPTITREAVKEALMLAVHKLTNEYPGYEDMPWHDEVARQVAMREKIEKQKVQQKQRRNQQIEVAQ